MNHKLKVNMEFVISVDMNVPLRNVNANLRNLISKNIHEEITFLKFNHSKVSVVRDLLNEKQVELEARNLINAMDQNTVMLWTPDFKSKVEAIIVNPTRFNDEEEKYSLDGINIEKLNLEEALKINRDYSGG